MMKFSCIFGKHKPDWPTLSLRPANEEERALLVQVGLAHLTGKYEVRCANCGAIFHDFGDTPDFLRAREALRLRREVD
jgi:hypothetical protein